MAEMYPEFHYNDRYPEIVELKKSIPITGIGIHGTSLQNYLRMRKEGFILGRNHKSLAPDFAHYFHLPHTDWVGTNGNLKRKYYDAIYIALDRANEFSKLQQSVPVLAILETQIQPDDIVGFNYEPSAMRLGMPIFCKTKDVSRLKPLEYVDFTKKDGQWDLTRTIFDLANSLKRIREQASTPTSEPQSPAQG